MLVVNNISKGGLLESSSLIPEKPGDLESLYQTTLLHGLFECFTCFICKRYLNAEAHNNLQFIN